MSFSDQVLDWVLRHGKSAGAPEEHDLVLVVDHPALAEPSPSATLGGQTWRIKRVTGELTLRDALLEAGRLVAIVPTAFVVPMDLAGRAWLGRQARVRPRDLVAALTSRQCEPISDEKIAVAVEASLQQLQAHKGGWSVAGTVTVREIRNVLLGLQLGADNRFDREAPDALLARWLLQGAPEVTSPELLGEALRQEHGKVGEWLAWAVTEGSLEAMIAAGALVGSGEGAALAPAVSTVSGPSDRHRLRSVVEQAVRAAWPQNPGRVRRVLQDAERRSAELPPTLAPSHPLLSGLLERFLAESAAGAASGEPVGDAALEALATNLHLQEHQQAIDLVRNLSRLARLIEAVPLPEQASLGAWAEIARGHIAWGDLAFRRARRGLGDAGPRLAPAARLVLNQYANHRDTLNAAFADWFVASWGSVSSQTDVRAPFALQHLSRLVLKPLVKRGKRVLLLVLDGCDLASFVDLMETAAQERKMAIRLPKVGDPDLQHDLRQCGPWRVAVAPIPTVTSHARRALFAGDLPLSTALDATEEAAANASNDKKAFDENPTLGTMRRTLLLKGDVGDVGDAVRRALGASFDLVAVVLNDVDDALASKETTPMRPWRLELLGQQAAGWLQEAAESGWTVVITADHGHTPYVASDRKLALPGSGGRIALQPGSGVAVARTGPLPASPLHLLHGFGAWRGQQRRGWHGGVGLEEVFVPLAFIEKGREHHESFAPPRWWRWAAVDEAPSPEPEPKPAAPQTEPDTPAGADVGVEVPEAVAEALRFFADGRTLVEHVVNDGPVAVSEVGRRMGFSEADIRRLVEDLLGFLSNHGVSHAVVVQGDLLAWSEGGTDDDWLARIADELDRKVLGYLHRHGSVVEQDLVELIGSPRKARRFASRVEELAALAPFGIALDSMPDGTKRYSIVRE